MLDFVNDSSIPEILDNLERRLRQIDLLLANHHSSAGLRK